jgi:ADP-ribosylglycohydrolase
LNRKFLPDLSARFSQETYENAVVCSALWTASGDALGWITELSRGVGGVKHRSGVEQVSKPIPWKRLTGGRFGATVDFPAGAYSDDTQLRLAVSRAIQGSGEFDVEAFAKVELTVWQCYALGAGNGTKAAAANLSKKGVNWFSNFFKSDDQNYVRAGGNGAAMRIQPHVWSWSGSIEGLVTQVLRDALVSHGHPHRFCGVVFHALCLYEALHTQKVPEIQEAYTYLDIIESLPEIIASDSALSTFWLSSWEAESNQNINSSIEKFCKDAKYDIDLVLSRLSQNMLPS